MGTRHLPQSVRLAKTGGANDVDLVHINNAIEGQPDALLAAKLLRIPSVAHARGEQTASRSARLYASGVDRHIAISTYIARNLQAMGVPSERIELIPDGVDLEVFCPGTASEALNRSLGIPSGARIFGIFGRIIPWKGISEFIQAAAVVTAQAPDAVALVVGDPSDGGESYYRTVKGLAAASPAPERIIFTGYRSDVADLMRLCDVVVHASTDPEPFGMVLAEAMACGRPVIAADEGGPRDIVTQETGILADPRDTEGLAGHIRRLLEDEGLRRSMGERALRRARREYSARTYAQRVLRVYEDVLGSGAKPRTRR